MVDIIDEDGRLFGLVNIVDLLVVVLVVAMVAAGWALLSSSGGAGNGSSGDKNSAGAQTTLVTFESEQVRPYVAEAIENGSVGGTEVVAVRSKSVEPATVVVTDQNGQLYVREHPRLESVTLRLELNTTETERGPAFTGVWKSGSRYVTETRRVRIGERLRLGIGDATLVGNITAIHGTNQTARNATAG